MNIIIFVIILALFIIITLLGKNKWIRGISFLTMFGLTLFFIVNIFACDNEKYIQIMNKQDEIIKVRLDNKNEYYGYRFNRFSTYLSDKEVLESVKGNYSNAYYDENNQRIIFEDEGKSYMIVKESESTWLWRKRTNYLFAELE